MQPSLRSDTMTAPDQRLQEALMSLQAGDTSRAEAMAKAIIRTHPQHEGARLLLAKAQRAQGQNKQALQSCKDGIKVLPHSVALLIEQALALRASGRAADAEQSYREALCIDPQQVTAMHNLANLLQARKEMDEAQALYDRVLVLSPKLAQAHYELGNVQSAKGNASGALKSWQDALLIQPAMAPAWFSLGKQLQGENTPAAIHALQKGLNIDANNAEALALLSRLLSNVGRATEAEQYASMAIGMAPNLALAHYALGLSWRIQGRAAAAIEPLLTAERTSTDAALISEAVYLRATCLFEQGHFSQAAPLAQQLLAASQTSEQLSQANHLSGVLLFESGRTVEARTYFAKALELSPGNVLQRISYCATSAYSGELNGQGQLELALKHIGPITTAGAAPSIDNRSTDSTTAPRRFRLGFISADFRRHSCAYFLEPLLANIDQRHFELFAYQTCLQSDEITNRLQQWIGTWRVVAQLNTQELAHTMAQDDLDVLIDLTGLTDGGRIEALAAQPARVQINWLGYLGTTGHQAIQYRLTDAHIDGPEQEGHATETPLRLARPYVCYQAPDNAPEASSLPMLSAPGPTFGSFNALTKLSDACVDLWSRVLLAIPHSRLLMKTKALIDQGARQHTLDRFATFGITADRVELLGWVEDLGGHMGLYRRIDVALDTTPFNGVTTTCEALWMGVPVVSLVGETYTSRQGLSLLHGVGLPELAVHSEAEFVQRCVELVSQADILADMRRNLRSRMSASALTDGAAFARAFEQAVLEAHSSN
jgi:protein O-GlcNAc transferase